MSKINQKLDGGVTSSYDSFGKFVNGNSCMDFKYIRAGIEKVG